MGVSETEWNATVENLVKALDKRNVPVKEKSELLGLLGPMKGDIVGQ
jgi:hemoglobin